MSDVKIENVMPWGRSMDEYIHMFALSEKDLSSRILSCADGPASFNAEMTERGRSVTSVDPVYAFPPAEILQRIHETKELILENTKAHMDNYHWDAVKDIDTLEKIRMSSMHRFLDDFELGQREGRYITGSLPEIDLPAQSFDLVLCSHCLFTYTDQLDQEFHTAAILEMLRLGKEVRIFPLLDLNGNPSKHLDLLINALKQKGYRATKIIVPYEFQIGGNQMLRLRPKQYLSTWISGLITRRVSTDD